MDTAAPMNDRRVWLAPTLVVGFAVAVAVWVAAFLIHLPTRPAETSASPPVGQAQAARAPVFRPSESGPTLVAVWVLAAAFAGRMVPRRQSVIIGALGGVLTGALCVLILGSMLVVQPKGGAPAQGAAGLEPSALLVVPAFLVLGAVLSFLGVAIGARTKPESAKSPTPSWLFRFSVVAVGAFVPLLLVGALVTTTDSGMAIKGWPDSYGANMFLYPLSLMVSDHQRFLEHAHRLFGALVGLTTLALLALTFSSNARQIGSSTHAAARVKQVAVLLFALVCIQGGLGGARVLENSRWMAAFHGVFAQLIFALAVALAAFLSPTFRATAPLAASPTDRRLRFFTTGLLHATLLQLLLGAIYRHLRESHALWTHAGFSLIVLIVALAAGFMLINRRTELPALTRTLSRLGKTLVGVVVLQFLLGWAAFSMTGKDHQSGDLAETLVRTAHQANGALLLATATLAFTWTRRLLRATAPTPAKTVPERVTL